METKLEFEIWIIKDKDYYYALVKDHSEIKQSKNVWLDIMDEFGCRERITQVDFNLRFYTLKRYITGDLTLLKSLLTQLNIDMYLCRDISASLRTFEMMNHE